MTPEQQQAVRDMYIELNRNESRIVTERLRAMLTFHGLLFAAVGVAAGQRLFLLALLLACVAALVCVPWVYSILLSYWGLEELSKRYNNTNTPKPAHAPGLDAYSITKRWEFPLLPEVFLPVAVALTWVLVCVVVRYYWQYPPPLPPRS
jgi:hypothetical protein